MTFAFAECIDNYRLFCEDNNLPKPHVLGLSSAAKIAIEYMLGGEENWVEDKNITFPKDIPGVFACINGVYLKEVP